MRGHESGLSFQTLKGDIFLSLTLQAISVEQVLALLVAFDAALCATHSLASNTPQQSLALVAVSGRGGRPHLKIVWGGTRDGIYERLEGLLVDVTLLHRHRGDTQGQQNPFVCLFFSK